MNNRQEQIEQARRLIATGISKELVDVLQSMFPELKESEDERIRKALVKTFEKKLENGFEWTEFGIPNRSVLDWLEKQKEQQPAEWSEEDELMRTVVIQTLERFGGRGTTEMQIDWLKSLRPQPRWKPSEEQMETLEYYMHALVCNEHKEILFGLYKQLKSL